MSEKKSKLRKNDERKQRPDVEVMGSGYQPSKKMVELINHAFFVFPFSFFLALRQPALRCLSTDSEAGHWCQLRSRRSIPLSFNGVLPRLLV